MTEGTRSLLFGVHQVVWHPVAVGVAYRRHFHRWPSWWQWVCIVVHDWGYWGKNYLTTAKAKADHHELGARLAERLVGARGRAFCENHRSASQRHSELWIADKYSHLVQPRWLKWVECFVERFHSRRSTDYLTPPQYRMLMYLFLARHGYEVRCPRDVREMLADKEQWELQWSSTSTIQNLSRGPGWTEQWGEQ